MGPARRRRPPERHRGRLPVGPERLGLRQQLLRGRRPGRARKSWKAFFFGSLDSSNFITVDKPPASLWVMELSARIFGFNSWSLLVPQALEGVAAVALLYAAVKRWFGPAAGLLAGARPRLHARSPRSCSGSTTPTPCWCCCSWRPPTP